MKLKEIFKYRKRDTQHEIGEWYVGWKSSVLAVKCFHFDSIFKVSF